MALQHELTAELTQAHNAFLMAAFALSPHLRVQSGVCGTWTPKQVAAHAAAWNAETVARFDAFHEESAPDKQYDTDAFNAAAVAERSSLNWDQQMEQLNQSYQALLTAASKLSVSDFAREGRYEEWLRGRIADYQEHTAQLEVWNDTALPNM